MDGVAGPRRLDRKTDPDGKDWELIAIGFRNPYDLAFNRDGELFTYDADMEWDINTPWYRPTRVCHVDQRREFGWRNGAGKWPAYYLDSLAAGRRHRPRLAHRRHLRLRREVPGEVPGRALHLRLELRQALRRPPQARRGQLHGRGRGVRQRHAAAADRRGRQPEGRRDVLRHRRPEDEVGPLPRDLHRRRGRRDEPAGAARRPTAARGTCAGAGGVPRARRTRRRSRRPGRTWATRTASSATPPGSPWSARTRRDGGRRPWPRRTRARPSRPCWPSPASAARTRPIASRPIRRPIPPCKARSWPPWTRSTGRAWAAPIALDLLRVYAVAFIRLGRPDDEACRRLIAKFDPLFPARSRGGRPPSSPDARLPPGAHGRRQDMAALREGPDAGGADRVRPRRSAG